MALPIPINNLSVADLRKISKDLTIYPKKSGKRHYKIIPLSVFNRANIMQDDKLVECVMLPYRYCINNFKDKSIPPEDTPSVKFKFIKTEEDNLRDEQIPVVKECLQQLEEYSNVNFECKNGIW